MKFERSSGVILHPTSLPGGYGIGEIGPAAWQWVDLLAEAGCKLWQVLPLGPTGYGDSPYQSFSTFAGNPYIISIEALLEEGLLTPDDVAGSQNFPTQQVDFGAIIPWKVKVLDRAYENFQHQARPELLKALENFRQSHGAWLEDFALFMALKDAHNGAPWPTWEPDLRDHKAPALETARQKHADSFQRQIFRQFLFFRQWTALHNHAQARGVQIIGDVPIFVAHDSADVWGHPELFYLDPQGKPTVVAGVPPDYFSPTGQLWGNPLYRWDVHAGTGYQWWLERLKAVLNLVDIVRLDHFRGFAGYWEVKGDAKTAEKGRWVRGPGKAFFNHIQKELGELPLIAEDLGEITPDVLEMRDAFELPGMKVLQFAFYGHPEEKFLPHNYPQNCVVYTGTHDNDTTLGWFNTAPEKDRDFVQRYLGRSPQDVPWNMIRAAWSSVAVFALAPLQDLLGLGTEARMNLPGRPSGNWFWRMPARVLYDPPMMGLLKEFNFVYGRGLHLPPEPEPAEPKKYIVD